MIDSIREFVEERFSTSKPIEAFRYPLGYNTWGVEEVLAAVDCLCDRMTTMWSKCEAFEQQFADYVGTKHAVMVNSGSSADLVLMLALRESGRLNRGDEMLIPAVTWPTQVWSAVEAGFKVRLVDIDLSTLNTSVELLEAAITPKTKAIFLVHLMGNPCQMDAIMDLASRRGLIVLEDCCEALGASFDDKRVGAIGLAGTFSFFASHHISTMEGGMITTNDDGLADAFRLMRAHGWARDLKHFNGDVAVLNRYGSKEDPRYLFLGMGFNFRPTELNAEIGRIQLTKLDSMNGLRNKNAAYIADHFRSTNGHFIEGLSTFYNAKPAWFALAFVLRTGLPYSRDEICGFLKTNGIDTRPIVGGNLARHPAFWKYRDMLTGPLRAADAVHDRGFYIGLPPLDCSMAEICGTLNSMDAILRCA